MKLLSSVYVTNCALGWSVVCECGISLVMLNGITIVNNEPAHKTFVIFTWATSRGSNDPMHLAISPEQSCLQVECNNQKGSGQKFTSLAHLNCCERMHLD